MHSYSFKTNTTVHCQTNELKKVLPLLNLMKTFFPRKTSHLF